MSKWTHITACLSVDTFITENKLELKKRVKDFLKNAPKITGSEQDADIFVNVLSGHDFYISCDCDHCKYESSLKKTVTAEGHIYTECNAPKNYNCSAEYQTRIAITIQGDLRDRTRKQTQKEFKEFLKYINTMYTVRNYSVNIE